MRQGGTGIAVFVTAGLLLSACSSSPDATPTTSPSSSPVATAPSTTVGTPAPSQDEQVRQVWDEVQQARVEEISSADEPNPDRFDALTTDAGQTTLADLVHAGRGDVASTVTDVETWPRIELAADGRTATVDDCLLVEQAAAGGDDGTVASQVWTGRLVETGGRWLVDEMTPREPDCIPDQLNQELLAAYRSWHAAKNEWWSPPNPDHPALERTMAGTGLQDMRDLLAEQATQGIEVRDTHDPVHAAVTELGIGTATVSDCFPAFPDNVAAYDPQTGERREDLSPTPTEGQIDQVVVSLRRNANGEWRVTGWRSTSNNDCTPGETPYVVAP